MKKRKKKTKITKRQYVVGFFVVVAVLALFRLLCPSIAGGKYSDQSGESNIEPAAGSDADSLGNSKRAQAGITRAKGTVFFNADGTPMNHKVKGVWSYKDCAPDTNAVHLAEAKKYGVVPVEDIKDAERRKHELVYIGSNPFYKVRRLQSSIPYLVPRAAALLQDIGRNFMDSLALKHVPVQKIVVTSVLRSKDDVVKLSKHNKNVSPNSCHVYGTTFDISYTHYEPLEAKVDDDRYKKTLSEVLRDLRDQGRCYVKYELHQACYHVTVR